MADEEKSSSSDRKPLKKTGNLKKSKTVCHFYAKNGHCKFEEKCRFVHPLESTTKNSGKSPAFVDEFGCNQISDPLKDDKETSDKVELQNSVEGISTARNVGASESLSIQVRSHDEKPDIKVRSENDTDEKKRGKSTSTTRCRFFYSRGGCSRGDSCKFSHVKPKSQRNHSSPTVKDNNKVKKDTISTGDVDQLKSSIQHNRVKVTTKAVTTFSKLSTIDENEVKKLRSRELEQIVRRFGKKGLRTVQEASAITYYIDFTPSDPDWPFDVEKVLLEASFPDDYPKQMFLASLSQEQDLPLDLIRVVNSGIDKWIKQQQRARHSKDTVDLPFRPFLRWLDRNLEKLFIEAAKQMREKEEFLANEEETFELSESGDEDSEVHKASEGRKDIENVDPNTSKLTEKEKKTNSNKQRKQHKDSHYYSSSDRKDIQLSDFLTFTKPNKNKEAASDKYCHGNQQQQQELKRNHIVFVDQDFEPTGRGKNESLMEKTSMHDNEASSHGNLEMLGVNFDDMDLSVDLEHQEDNSSQLLVADQKSQDASNEKPRGTEIRFKGLELSENTSTLATDSIALTMECDKCKTRVDTKVASARTATAIRCEKCANVLRISFRPSIIHQFSSTLGYLDLEGWHPFDLIITDMQLMVGCLACSNETSLKGSQYGTNQIWCSKCHQKCTFQIESTRFFQIKSTSAIRDKADLSVEKLKKKPKVTGIKEGFPLPNNGTCKHYKKSFRWLRFPCCGKCFPCDICHEEQEDHEMKFASRMVCGFCSKEQRFSQNQCVACNYSMTKAKSCHWEGGKGCRNKTFMSKGDDRKFKNITKTTSRKALSKEQPKAKAKTT